MFITGNFTRIPIELPPYIDNYTLGSIECEDSSFSTKWTRDSSLPVPNSIYWKYDTDGAFNTILHNGKSLSVHISVRHHEVGSVHGRNPSCITSITPNRSLDSANVKHQTDSSINGDGWQHSTLRGSYDPISFVAKTRNNIFIRHDCRNGICMNECPFKFILQSADMEGNTSINNTVLQYTLQHRDYTGLITPTRWNRAILGI